jgi:hypothetical protein
MNRHVKRTLEVGLLIVALISAGVVPARIQAAALIPTMTMLASLQNPAPAEESVTFTASVKALELGAGVPTGTVEFFAGPISLGTASLTDSGGVGTASLSVQLAPGLHPILVHYHGDGSFAVSISVPPLPQRVMGQ